LADLRVGDGIVEAVYQHLLVRIVRVLHVGEDGLASGERVGHGRTIPRIHGDHAAGRHDLRHLLQDGVLVRIHQHGVGGDGVVATHPSDHLLFVSDLGANQQRQHSHAQQSSSRPGRTPIGQADTQGIIGLAENELEAERG